MPRRAAEEAFRTYGYATREERATFLDTNADENEARAERITEIGTQDFSATSVGTLTIRRFLRPVCYQNLPAGVLPDDLKEGH